MRSNVEHFVDLTFEQERKENGSDCACLGYINEHRGVPEYLFTDRDFERAVGGKNRAALLKRELAMRGEIASRGAGGDERRYAVKRTVPSEGGGSRRDYFIAVHACALS